MLGVKQLAHRLPKRSGYQERHLQLSKVVGSYEMPRLSFLFGLANANIGCSHLSRQEQLVFCHNSSCQLERPERLKS
jgi:hypothetical protein